MAKLVNTNQGIITGVTHPAAGYSRLLACLARPLMVDTTFYAFTGPSGDCKWLRNIWVHVDAAAGAFVADVDVSLRFGTAKPTSYADMQSWEELMPIYRTGRLASLRTHHESKVWSFSLLRLFEDPAIRFGFSGGSVITKPLEVMAVFEISEG